MESQTAASSEFSVTKEAENTEENLVSAAEM